MLSGIRNTNTIRFHLHVEFKENSTNTRILKTKRWLLGVGRLGSVVKGLGTNGQLSHSHGHVKHYSTGKSVTSIVRLWCQMGTGLGVGKGRFTVCMENSSVS